MDLRFGENLAKLRINHHYTQGDLAEKLDVSSNAVSTWETDQACPSLDHLLMLADLYNTSVDDLIRPKDIQKYPFHRLYVPYRHIRTTIFGYYPETYVDYVEDIEHGLYTAWLWTTYYPHKRCVYALPVKNVSLDNFMSFIQDHAVGFYNQFFEELEKLVPEEELKHVKDNIGTIAAIEEFAVTPYSMKDYE